MNINKQFGRMYGDIKNELLILIITVCNITVGYEAIYHNYGDDLITLFACFHDCMQNTSNMKSSKQHNINHTAF